MSEFFSAAEFECKDGCNYGKVHPDLVALLERARRRIGGKPIHIVSGLRCPPRNVAVGGSPRSAHQWGGAADIPSGLLTEAEAKFVGFTGIGLSGKWVTHVDVRRTRTPVVWQY